MLTRNKRLRDTMIGIPAREAAGDGSAGRKRSLKLSLFVGFGEPAGPDISAKSPRSFRHGAVGLGIVAAMSGAGGGPGEPSRPERSEPIPIVPARPVARLTRPGSEEEEGELSESYTCVTSHVGGRPVRRRVYDEEWMDGNGGNYGEEMGVFFGSPVEEVAGFLSWCYLCGKKLHGLDVFMYSGEKAFCSVECRCQHILFDEHKEKWRSESVKPLMSTYVDPSPAPLLFYAGVAAA